MKFSIVATALLAQGIAAMPWTSVKSQSNGEEITLRIQVSGASGSKFTPEPKGAINYKNYDVCLKVCWPEEPKCPEGWNSKKFGEDDYPCWTCCKSTGDDDL
ncbi:hypothetical protein BKA59DRAFT_516076 [Fusarium tricinctum]|uniref:Pathogenicity protein n=1 Tax=Fusarium tricinctum TaxID=61284 RepID=A0A8K0W7W6_9HYPO|nr:hypothetical protein BKA59DRAFT_516076 [Fusarium tricinctum]